jgi:hypothetical protein
MNWQEGSHRNVPTQSPASKIRDQDIGTREQGFHNKSLTHSPSPTSGRGDQEPVPDLLWEVRENLILL